MNPNRYYLRTNPITGNRYMASAADGALNRDAPLWVPDGDYRALWEQVTELVDAVEKIACDFVPDCEAEALLALEEMREALVGLVNIARLGGEKV
ncbi:hypothetical protein [Pseudoxanthomonas sp.]|uniref:hypothetical protein n=1 Tax=Pseudoxanthomonas sp. TaxID=1871049 RepID=UPI003F7E181A